MYRSTQSPNLTVPETHVFSAPPNFRVRVRVYNGYDTVHAGVRNFEIFFTLASRDVIREMLAHLNTSSLPLRVVELG